MLVYFESFYTAKEEYPRQQQNDWTNKIPIYKAKKVYDGLDGSNLNPKGKINNIPKLYRHSSCMLLLLRNM